MNLPTIGDDVVMRAILAARMMELAGRARLIVLDDAERARHAQMHQEHVTGAEVRQKVFGAAAEAGHGLAGKPRHKVPLERKTQVFAPDFHFHDPGSLHHRLQAAADGLDFG